MRDSYLGQLLLVGMGGFLGAAGRFAVSGLAHRLGAPDDFPWGTLTVNVLGCLAIGFLAGLMELRQLVGPSQRLFLLIGALGGFTTFSTFAYETLGLLHASEMARALGNVAAHVVLGLAAAWIGYVGAQAL
jgi:CrcB protein